MTPEQLFTHFDRLSEAPDAIPRLRGFVLDLAFRGALTNAQHGDGTAQDLLREIADVRSQSSSTSRVAGAAGAEAPPFDLPARWTWAKLEDIFAYDVGINRAPGELAPEGWLLDLEDIEKDTSVLLRRATVKERTPQSTKTEFQRGDILYGKLRPYLNKVIVAPEPGYATTEIVALRPYVPLPPRFCMLALRRPDVVERVTRLGQGTKMPRLRTKDALESFFPLPPRAEQRRIVVKVDELMALCDRLEAAQGKRERRRDRLATTALASLTAPQASASGTSFRDSAPFAIANVHRLFARPDQVAALRDAIHAIAVSGGLVRQDSSESIEHQLTEADAVRADVAVSDRRADPRPQTLLAEELRWNIPSAWVWRALADLVLFIDYRGKTPTKVASGIRLITAKNVKPRVIAAEPQEFISADEYGRWMTRGLPAVGDVLFTTEAPMGNASVVRSAERFALAQRIIDFRAYGAVDPDFLVLYLLSPQFQSILDHTATGLTAKGIKAAKLKRLPVAVPPLQEQRRIVAKVEELLRVSDELQDALSKVQANRVRLLDTLLRDALAGVGVGR